jgi:hypothetical protein
MTDEVVASLIGRSAKRSPVVGEFLVGVRASYLHAVSVPSARK